MGKYILLVHSNPTQGKEADYNDWYDNIHLPEVCALPGFCGAQRYKMEGDPMAGESAHRYVAVYEIDADDPQTSLAALGAGVADGSVRMSDAIDGNTIQAVLFKPWGDKLVTKP